MLLVLTLTGAITLGDIFGFIFGVIGIVTLVALIGLIVLRIKIAKARKAAEARGEQFTGYTWHFGSHTNGSTGHTANTHTNPDEGRVRVSRTMAPKKKKVNKNVGEYVDFEEE